MKDIRCDKCNKLLGKAQSIIVAGSGEPKHKSMLFDENGKCVDIVLQYEIKCTRCGTINKNTNK